MTTNFNYKTSSGGIVDLSNIFYTGTPGTSISTYYNLTLTQIPTNETFLKTNLSNYKINGVDLSQTYRGNYMIFNSNNYPNDSSYTIIVPTNCTNINIMAQGGGGSGQNSGSGAGGDGGTGAGGGFVSLNYRFSSTPISLNIIVGSGGAAGRNTGMSWTDGSSCINPSSKYCIGNPNGDGAGADGGRSSVAVNYSSTNKITICDASGGKGGTSGNNTGGGGSSSWTSSNVSSAVQFDGSGQMGNGGLPNGTTTNAPYSGWHNANRAAYPQNIPYWPNSSTYYSATEFGPIPLLKSGTYTSTTVNDNGEGSVTVSRSNSWNWNMQFYGLSSTIYYKNYWLSNNYGNMPGYNTNSLVYGSYGSGGYGGSRRIGGPGLGPGYAGGPGFVVIGFRYD
jgi:hypothetical protein